MSVMTRNDDPVVKTLLKEALEAINAAPKHAVDLLLSTRRLGDAVLGLWTANKWLRASERQAKVESIALHHLLSAVIERYGELRFTKEELDVAPWDRRIRGFLVPGTTDVVLRLSTEGLLMTDAPRWLADAAEGRPVPELTLTKPHLTAIFDVTDMDATKPKAMS